MIDVYLSAIKVLDAAVQYKYNSVYYKPETQELKLYTNDNDPFGLEGEIYIGSFGSEYIEDAEDFEEGEVCDYIERDLNQACKDKGINIDITITFKE